MKRLTTRQRDLVRSLIPLATVEEIAELVGVSLPTVYRIRQAAVATARQIQQDSAATKRFLEDL